MEPCEVAEAFDILHKSGKVRYFGVSNQKPMQIELLKKYINQPIVINQLQFSIAHTGMIKNGLNVNMVNEASSNQKPMQIELLKKYINQPIVINQLQFSIAHTGMIKNGLNVNMVNEASVDHDGSILDYCRLNDITIQPWSPFQYGFFEGVFLDNEKFPELNKKINELAEKYGVTNSAIAIAWILRHPANMQPVLGTVNADRIKAIAKAAEFRLSREEWYDVFRAAGNVLP